MEQADKFGLYADERENTGAERMVAFHSAILAINCLKPCAGLFTYNREEETQWGQYILAKILPYVHINGQLFGPSDAKEMKAFDIAGGIICEYKIQEIAVKIEIFPLLYGQKELTEAGGAVYCISTQPQTPVFLNIGGGKTSGMVGWKQIVNEEGKLVDLMTVMTRATMVSEKFREKEPQVEILKDTALLTSVHPYTIAIKGEGKITKEVSPEGGQYICVSLEKGSGKVAFAFDRNKDTAIELISKDYNVELEKSKKYYAELMDIKIETPEPNLDFTFKSALYNLDYNYLAPYGWVEAVHHWMSIWHQQHSLAADWIGQQDRAKQVLISQGKSLYPDGAAPMFLSNGHNFRAFGGTDHFYLWQARHYLLQSNDTAFAKEILPTLETVAAHCFSENDPNGSLRLHWGEQIGNQEDYISHIHASTSPTIEGINMLESLALAASMAEQKEKCERYTTLAKKARESLKALWNDDLGRFIYQKDTTGKEHLEGQYQTYIYPCIYDMVDDCDSYTSLRHLRDRLIGEKGELYCSNNFANHMTATLGTQAGAAQQPWGAMGLAKMGFADEAILPLKYISDIVADPNGCAGSWPEVAESWGSYFSPPAGVFLQAVIEAIYGLKINMPAKTLTLSPCFPAAWDKANLTLPEYKVAYKKQGNQFSFSIKTNEALTPILKWRLPFGKVNAFKVNGEKANFSLTPCVNGLMLESILPLSTESDISFEFKEINLEIQYSKTVAEGSVLSVCAKGAKICGVMDRSALCSELSYGEKLELTLKNDLLAPYKKFGKLGLLNFSRRTIFLKLQDEDGLQTIYPLDFTLIPPLEASAILKENMLSFTIRNNCQLSDTASLLIGDEAFSFKLKDKIVLNMTEKANLLPGNNDAMLFAGNASANFKIKSHKPMPTKTIPIPEGALENDACWKELKAMPFRPHMPWLNQKDPMSEMVGDTLTHPDLPVTFHVMPNKFAPLSWKSKPRLDIPLDGEYRKFYILLFSFLDNHNVFSPALRITAQREDQKLSSKEYCYPGDLDGFWGVGAVGCFATAHSYFLRDSELLPLPDKENGDWSIAKPKPDNIYYFAKEYGNSFPSSAMWNDSYTIKLPNSYVNIIEFDMQKSNKLTQLTLEPIGTNTAFGIVAIEGI